jgi:hypothetical protein
VKLDRFYLHFIEAHWDVFSRTEENLVTNDRAVKKLLVKACKDRLYLPSDYLSQAEQEVEMGRKKQKLSYKRKMRKNQVSEKEEEKDGAEVSNKKMKLQTLTPSSPSTPENPVLSEPPLPEPSPPSSPPLSDNMIGKGNQVKSRKFRISEKLHERIDVLIKKASFPIIYNGAMAEEVYNLSFLSSLFTFSFIDFFQRLS